jgi:hypothetical protein
LHLGFSKQAALLFINYVIILVKLRGTGNETFLNKIGTNEFPSQIIAVEIQQICPNK